jgi:2,5-diketo-D-gluconate reductase A
MDTAEQRSLTTAPGLDARLGLTHAKPLKLAPAKPEMNRQERVTFRLSRDDRADRGVRGGNRPRGVDMGMIRPAGSSLPPGEHLPTAPVTRERGGNTRGMTTDTRHADEPANATMNDGRTMPRIGFGVFLVPPDETLDAVAYALRTGYRAVDTAAAYGNEREVGEAVRASGVGREEVFVTTKLWNSDHGGAAVQRAFARSLDRLGFDYVDLYLIHWPAPARGLYVETWEALIELREGGRARSIGVSNFEIEHLERILDATGVVPAVNQVELHPRLQQPELRRFHAEHGIVTEAWSPIAKGRVLDDPVITELAARAGRTPAQAVLRWHLQLGNVVIPKSVTPERIEENFRIFDFTLDDDAVGRIETLDAGARTGPDPATFNG